jgi:small GTP-binding protein
MFNVFITGIILSEFDSQLGPIAIGAYPGDLNIGLRKSVAAKTIDTIFLEFELPKTTTIMDFTQYDKKGITKAFTWNKTSLRGGKGKCTLTIVYDPKEDMIFYKYRNDLEPVFEEMITHIVGLKEKETESINYTNILMKFHQNITATLNSLAKLEMRTSNFTQKEFPSVKDAYNFKIIVIGDPEVGKTSTILRFVDNAFLNSYLPTVGVNISAKTVLISNKIANTVLWDLAGQSKFTMVRHQFYFGSNGIIMVFDLTSRESFINIEKWYEDIKGNISNFARTRCILCGNKSDLEDRREIPKEEAEGLAKKLGIMYCETSALNGKNTKEMFELLVAELLKIY